MKACIPSFFSVVGATSSASGAFSCVAASLDLTGSSGLSISIAVEVVSGRVEGAAATGSSAILTTWYYIEAGQIMALIVAR